MQSDFYNLYKDYSTTELLKILRQSADYQPDAVAAAEHLLNTREISEQDREYVDKHFQLIEESIKAREQKLQGYKAVVTDFLEPVLEPSAPMNPAKWLKFVLLLIVISYTWSFYSTIVHFIHLFGYNDHHLFDVSDSADVLNLVYVPIVFYLLFKRNRWGWMLLFADNFICIFSQFASLIPFYFYQLAYHPSYSLPAYINTAAIAQGLLRIALAYFLWSPSMADFFGVNVQVKKRTLQVSIVLAIFLACGLIVLVRFF